MLDWWWVGRKSAWWQVRLHQETLRRRLVIWSDSDTSSTFSSATLSYCYGAVTLSLGQLTDSRKNWSISSLSKGHSTQTRSSKLWALYVDFSGTYQEATRAQIQLMLAPTHTGYAETIFLSRVLSDLGRRQYSTVDGGRHMNKKQLSLVIFFNIGLKALPEM